MTASLLEETLDVAPDARWRQGVPSGTEPKTGVFRLVDRAPTETLSEAPTLPRRSKPYTVLIVDDEEDIVESLRAALESQMEDVRVRTAVTGLEALRILERVPIDLIVTDFKMPGMDGFEFIDRAERVAPGLPRILISAFVYDVPTQTVERCKLDRFLSKPFSVHELVFAVTKALCKAS